MKSASFTIILLFLTQLPSGSSTRCNETGTEFLFGFTTGSSGDTSIYVWVRNGNEREVEVRVRAPFTHTNLTRIVPPKDALQIHLNSTLLINISENGVVREGKGVLFTSSLPIQLSAHSEVISSHSIKTLRVHPTSSLGNHYRLSTIEHSGVKHIVIVGVAPTTQVQLWHQAKGNVANATLRRFETLSPNIGKSPPLEVLASDSFAIILDSPCQGRDLSPSSFCGSIMLRPSVCGSESFKSKDLTKPRRIYAKLLGDSSSGRGDTSASPLIEVTSPKGRTSAAYIIGGSVAGFVAVLLFIVVLTCAWKYRRRARVNAEVATDEHELGTMPKLVEPRESSEDEAYESIPVIGHESRLEMTAWNYTYESLDAVQPPVESVADPTKASTSNDAASSASFVPQLPPRRYLDSVPDRIPIYVDNAEVSGIDESRYIVRARRPRARKARPERKQVVKDTEEPGGATPCGTLKTENLNELAPQSATSPQDPRLELQKREFYSLENLSFMQETTEATEDITSRPNPTPPSSPSIAQRRRLDSIPDRIAITVNTESPGEGFEQEPHLVRADRLQAIRIRKNSATDYDISPRRNTFSGVMESSFPF